MKNIIACMGIAASLFATSVYANPMLNGSFAFNGAGITGFVGSGGINTASSVSLQNLIQVSSVNATTFGKPNNFYGILNTGFFTGTLGNIYNTAPLSIADGIFATPISSYLTITATNSDTFTFQATQELVLARGVSGNVSSLSIYLGGIASDSANTYSPSSASVGLTFIDNAGNISYTGAFSAPPVAVPEPGTLFLMGIGVLGMGFWAARRKA